MEQGLVHIYCGDGKGKTTCAFGLALRCAGTGARVRIAQFLKSGDSGEVTAMQQFDNVELLRAKQGSKFTFQMNAAEKAQAWLDAHQINYTDRHIVEDNPSAAELAAWHQMSGLPLKKFFNTSGMLYRSMELKDKLPDMSEDEMLRLLATDGMLVKRPLLVGDDFVLAGFKETEWAEHLKNK